eukprot:2294118-Prymnesium_polylepis.2
MRQGGGPACGAPEAREMVKDGGASLCGCEAVWPRVRVCFSPRESTCDDRMVRRWCGRGQRVSARS